MPQFVAGDTQYDTSTTEPSAFVTPGIASLNLRGLGVNRNLVLIDGRRAQPANALLIVDINTIPSAAVERVETITGGASAVYGADALAGVVNFVLKDDFEGVSLDVKTGQTLEGDGSESKFSALIGMNAADDRGNVMFGVDWTETRGRHAKGPRLEGRGLVRQQLDIGRLPADARLPRRRRGRRTLPHGAVEPAEPGGHGRRMGAIPPQLRPDRHAVHGG